MLQRALFLLICLSCLFGTAALAGAATMSLADVAIGKIITVNGMKFAKINNQGEFTAICESNSCGSIAHCTSCSTQRLNYCTQCEDNYYAIGGVCVDELPTMQAFTTAQCNAYPTPAATNYTPIGFLQDERDGKSYEIRKFADGKCWMVDNLAYGGVTDACANKTTFSGNGSSSPTNRFGTGTYGDCRNNPGSSTYGYLYNWQAAMQHSSAYSNTDYTGPEENVQGLCPIGWHLPTGDYTGEYQALHEAAGSPTIGFWQPGGNWKGAYSDSSDGSGNLGARGSGGFYFSSTQSTAYLGVRLKF